MIGRSSYVSMGYTKIRVAKLIPIFFNKKIGIYLFSKQTVIGYDIDDGLKKRSSDMYILYIL